MDESSNEIDQLFRAAAEHAAGLDYVLDPAKAIERGNRRRKFARRRKNALSGLVVLAAVVVFLVPLPGLHLFGSTRTSKGTTTTTTAVSAIGPAGGAIPVNFQPRSFTAVSLEEWWMLGTARCPTGSGTCGAIVRSTDGGASFAGIPGPPVSTTGVTQMRFANALDGYAFDPELWETTNGGTSWSKVATPGPVTELETADGESYALSCPGGPASCQSMELLRSPVESLKWKKVSTPVKLSYGAQFAVSGPNLYVLSGNEPPLVLLYSADKAARFSKRVDPCSPTLGGSVTAAANGSATLWAACPSGTNAGTWLSNNGGKTWVRGQGGFPNTLHLAAASSSEVLAWPGKGSSKVAFALDRTTDGGKKYSPVLSVSNSAAVSWAEFSDPIRAYALGRVRHVTRLFESNDAGATWHPVVIRR